MATSKASASSRPAPAAAGSSVPVGGYVLAAAPIQFNTNRVSVTLKVRNTGDRPDTVGAISILVNRGAHPTALAFGMHRISRRRQ
jgi:hypothetical protein